MRYACALVRAPCLAPRTAQFHTLTTVTCPHAPSRSESVQLTLAPTSIGKPTTPSKAVKDVQKLTAFQASLVYTWYGNLALVAVCFIFFLAAQCSRQISDFWVRWWVNDEYKHFPKKGVQDSAATKFYCLIYLLLTGLFFTFMLLRGATFLWWTLRSAEKLRKKALHNVLNGRRAAAVRPRQRCQPYTETMHSMSP